MKAPIIDPIIGPEFLDGLTGYDWPVYAVAAAICALLVRTSTRPIDKIIDRIMTLATLGKFRQRDRNRTFSSQQRYALARRAGGRCEHKHPLWIRCVKPGEHADHIIPWSKGGPTAAINGQWLCRRHNLRKSALYPSPLYRWRLTHRRRRAARRQAR